MNERVMQFRIGMFMIVASLVFAMLIIWFGESPSLFRSQTFLTAHYAEAPGVSEGIPVRKSGIRIGEVTSVRFDDRPGQTDGVLVTIAFEKKFLLREGSIPKITRALIGDVAIEMLPGTGTAEMKTGASAATAPIVEGEVAPDPASALAAATAAFENVQGTLASIDDAAKGIAMVTKKAGNIDEVVASFRDMGNKVGVLAEDLDKMANAAGSDFPSAIANIRQVTDKLNTTLDAKTQADFRAAVRQLSSGSAKLDQILTDVSPLARDLGQDPNQAPSTSLGQAMMRLNRVAYDVGLLTAQLGDGRGRLNANGSMQKLVMTSELHDNINGLAISAREVMGGAKRLVANFNKFAERIANDPGAISRGALQRE